MFSLTKLFLAGLGVGGIATGIGALTTSSINLNSVTVDLDQGSRRRTTREVKADSESSDDCDSNDFAKKLAGCNGSFGPISWTS